MDKETIKKFYLLAAQHRKMSDVDPTKQIVGAAPSQLQRQRLDAVTAFDNETKKLTDQINAETKKALDALQKTRMAERSILWNKLTEQLKAIGA